MASKEQAAASGLNACIKGHIRDGNFHENIIYDSTKPEEVEKAKTAVKNMVRRAIKMEGTCTGKHGIGFGKKDALRQEVGNRILSFIVCSPRIAFKVLSILQLLTKCLTNRKYSKENLTFTGLCMIEPPVVSVEFVYLKLMSDLAILFATGTQEKCLIGNKIEVSVNKLIFFTTFLLN